MISGFCCAVDEICALLGCYAALNGNPLLMFQDNVSVPSSGVKKVKSSWTCGPLKVGLIRFSETSVKDYHSMLHNTPEEHISHRLTSTESSRRRISSFGGG
jgi:hypothetical protein